MEEGKRHRTPVLPSSARPRGCAPLTPAGEAGPRVRGVGSARPGWDGWLARTLAGRRVHGDTPRTPLAPWASAPHRTGSRPLGIRLRASPAGVGWEKISAPHIPAPPPCDSGGGGGEGLLICSGGEARETRRKRDIQKWSERETHTERGDEQRLDSPRGERE